MPLIERRTFEGEGVLGVWHITESDSYFLSRIDLAKQEVQQLGELKGHRRTEWLASRWLLHVMSERTERGPLIKDDCGKPHLTDSQWYISLSHTRAYTAVIAAPFLVGIDIQVKVDKIERIAKKFLSEVEYANAIKQQPIDCMHVYWGAKECLYKAYGRRALDFKKDICIDDFDLSDLKTSGKIVKSNQQFDVSFELNLDYILVFALNKIK